MSGLGNAALDHLRDVLERPDLSGTRYDLVEPIAQGGMGTVYRAWDRELARDVAIKVVRSELADSEIAGRLTGEAKILAQLEHPGLVPVHEVGRLADGRSFYVMRLVRGQELDLAALEVRTLPERLRLYLKILDPIAYAHSRGIIHRDLKPGNIMVGPFGEVLVLDWGIAKAVSTREAAGPAERTAALPGATNPGAVLGTYGFMAPEQAIGGSVAVDHRADVYSLGVILRTLINPAGSGAKPLVAIIARATAADPAARYAGVGDLAADVSAYLDGRPVAAYHENLIERIGRFVSRHQVAIGLVVAYLLMRIVLLVFR
ncbi:MAG: serine/threonine-protein kinase [Gemmatimonadota bacterium]